MRLPLFVFGLILVLFSCSKEDASREIDYGYVYFPLKQGSWKEFQIDSIRYTPFSTDSSSWICREVTDSVYPVSQDVYEALVFRYFRNADSVNWSPGYQITRLTRSMAQAEEWTNNTRYVRFVFPVYKDRIWDGNAMNTLGEQSYRYQFVGYRDTVGFLYYPDLVNVSQQYSISLISRDVEEETFSRNLGLIEVRKEHLENLTGIKTGYIMHKVLVDSGNF